MTSAGVPERDRDRARAAIIARYLDQSRIAGGWLLRTAPSFDFGAQLRIAKLPRRLLLLASTHATQYLFWILSWWIVGKGTLQGHMDKGWLIAWVLLLASLAPLKMSIVRQEARISIDFGGLLKRRLLAGVLRFDPEEIRRQGIGRFFSRVVESQAIEQFALSGGYMVLLSGIELLVTGILFAASGTGWISLFLLGTWIVLSGMLGWVYFQRYRNWSENRLAMTHNLVESMIGHRTRLAQECIERWHATEDQTLDRYLALSTAMDACGRRLLAWIPRGWLLIGMLGLVPTLITGSASTPMIAVNLGGILLAFKAFEKLTAGFSHLAGAAVAWQQTTPVFRAAARANRAAPLLTIPQSHCQSYDSEQNTAVLEVNDLTFRYCDSGKPILQSLNLRINPGEHILLSGTSGSGKSTFAAIVAGLLVPQSGLLLFHGIDRHTLGFDGWRRAIVIAPQFHENHVLGESFAFNLLMGRDWPARQEDLREAEVICRELGLGNLIDTMPGGLMQVVGESGWQLSHGETSRLYIARALLQKPELIIFDESFSALDPTTLHQVFECVSNRGSTLLVIAHP